MRTEFLTERLHVAAGRVDTLNHVIKGVKVLGQFSKNNREYTQAAMAGAVGLYEGAAVYLDHPKGSPGSPRSYGERVGTLVNVRLQDGGLYADLRYNPKHPIAEQLVHDAQHSPASCGLSHNVQASSTTRNGRTIVERILKVVSVDLVATPATVGGLFESLTGDGDTFVTRPELRAMLNVNDAVIDRLVGAGLPVANLGGEGSPTMLFSLSAVRQALAKLTGSPTASGEKQEAFQPLAGITEAVNDGGFVPLCR